MHGYQSSHAAPQRQNRESMIEKVASRLIEYKFKGKVIDL